MPPPSARDNSIPTTATDLLSPQRLVSLVDSELSEIEQERSFCKKTRGGNKVILNLHQHTAFTCAPFTHSRQVNASAWRARHRHCTCCPLLDVFNGICHRIFFI